MKYINQLSNEEIKEIFLLFLCDGGRFVSLEIARYEDSIELSGVVKEPDYECSDNEDEMMEVEDDYSFTDYFVSTYYHSGGSYCQKKFREYMYNKFGDEYAKDFLFEN